MRHTLVLALLAAATAPSFAQVSLTPTASPATAEPGSTVVTLTGSGFPAGAIAAGQVQVHLSPASTGAGPSVSTVPRGLQTVAGSTRRVTFVVPNTLAVAQPTAYRASISGIAASGAAFQSTNSSAVTIQPVLKILSSLPATAQPGQELAVLLRAQFANFVHGAVQAHFGEGISVGEQPVGASVAAPMFNAPGAVLVVSPNTILALVRVSEGAAYGPRGLSLTQGDNTYIRPNALTVQATAAGNSATAVANISGQATPQNGSPGITDFTLPVTGLPSGFLTPSQLRILLEPAAASGGGRLTITPAAVSDESVGIRTITFQVPGTLRLAALTDYVATVYGSTSNYGELPNGTSFLSANRALIRLGPAPAPAPALFSVDPPGGQQGQSLAVNVTGQNTNFQSGQTLALLGPGISVGGAAAGQFGPVNVVSPTSINAKITVQPGAALGPRDVQVRTGSQAPVTLRNAFSVISGSVVATISSVLPNPAQPGSSVVATVTGLPNAPLAAAAVQVRLSPSRSGAGPVRNLIASSISADNAGSRQIGFLLPADLALPQPELYRVTLSGTAAGLSFSTGTAGEFLLQPPPRLLTVAPSFGQRSQSLSVTISGLYTSFTANTAVSFGAGITVNAVTAQTSTSLSANITVASDAAAGPRQVSVTSGSQVLSLPNGFSVSNAPVSVSLTSPVSPATARPGDTVSVLAIHFPAGAVDVTRVTVLLEPAAGGAGTQVTPSSVQDNTGGARQLQFVIPASLTIPASTPYLVSISGATSAGVAFTSGNKAALTIDPALARSQISAVSPSQGTQGQALTVTITGQNTGFSPGATQVSFGTGITVNAVAVSTATSLSAQLAIAPDAPAGPRDVRVTTGAESLVTARAFLVLAAPTGPAPSISRIAPEIGATGSQVAVTVTGANTNFVQGQTVLSFGQGISPGPITVASPTRLSTVLTIAADAPAGPRTVTATTGGSTASLSNGFAVIGPEITLLSPADKSFVNTPSINVTGRVNDPKATVAVNGVAAPNSGGSFSVAIPLSEGNNTVTAVATTTGGATSSTSILVNLDTTPPRVAVLTPLENDQTTEERINVAGNVNDIVVGTVNDVQAQVTVNGIPAEVSNRSFVARNVPLQPGQNTLQVVSRDRVGNSFTASVKVNRVMAPLVKVKVISGNNQSARINTQLSEPVIVQLTDGLDIPKPNTSVFFQVTGNNGRVAAAPGGAGALGVEVRTDAQGRAQAFWTTGGRSGAGINRLEAGSTGVTAPAVFTATGLNSTAARIVVDSGLNQTGAVGQKLPLPFVAVVIDEGNNRLGGVPVTMTVRSGGGKIDGQNAVTVNSDPDGRVALTLTLGPQEGIENNEVVASFPGNAGASAVFTATGRVPKRIEDTKVSGVVLDNANQPIAGVTVKLLRLNQGASSNLPQQVGGTALSSALGYFEISGAPVGVFKLLVDGTTVPGANRYPTLEFDITTVAGQNNTIGMPVFLPALDTKNQLCVDELSGGTLTLPEAPGFSLTVAPGATTFPGGSKRGCISVTPVNIDRIPMTPGFGQQPRFVVTIQPAGASFNPPARLSIPNVDGLAPRSITEMYSYDHDLAAFVSIGSAVVSGDSTSVSSVPGSGVLKAGWHCGGDPTTTGACCNCPPCYVCTGAGCVLPQTPPTKQGQDTPLREANQCDECPLPRPPDLEGDCKKWECEESTWFEIGDSSDHPPDFSVGDCKRKICFPLGGTVEAFDPFDTPWATPESPIEFVYTTASTSIDTPVGTFKVPVGTCAAYGVPTPQPGCGKTSEGTIRSFQNASGQVVSACDGAASVGIQTLKEMIVEWLKNKIGVDPVLASPSVEIKYLQTGSASLSVFRDRENNTTTWSGTGDFRTEIGLEAGVSAQVPLTGYSIRVSLNSGTVYSGKKVVRGNNQEGYSLVATGVTGRLFSRYSLVVTAGGQEIRREDIDEHPRTVVFDDTVLKRLPN